MSNEIEIPEYIEPCDRSIVPEDYELPSNERPPLVTYGGVTGLMLRWKAPEGDELLNITKTEFDVILADLNKAEDL